MHLIMYCQWLRYFQLHHLKWKRVKYLLLLSAMTAGMLMPREASCQTVNMKGGATTLQQFFKEVRSQTGYVFSYNAADVKGTGQAHLPTGNYPLREALDRVLKPLGLTYAIRSKTIVVSKDPGTGEPPKPSTKDAGNDRVPENTIRGQVVDAEGVALGGITVTIKGSGRGVATDNAGRFYFDNVGPGAVVIVQGIGYASREFAATPEMTIQLIREISGLDEVQVIAYGTTTRRLNTGSVSSVTAADIASQPVSNPLAALQGRIPGLIITQTSGVPGSSFNVLLRGQSALDPTYSKNDPLFIIDGVPFEPGNLPTNQISNAANKPTNISERGLSPLNLINPQDIERIDVLKDADATAIYGSRGANGVILITTKKGIKGSTQASINVYSGISRVGRTMSMLNLPQYFQMRREAFANDSIAMDTQNAPDLLLWDTTRYTDFKDLLIGRTATINNANISITGGSELTRFRAAAGYRRETSVYSTSLSDKVASFSINVSHQTANKRLQLNVSAQYGNDHNTLPRFDMAQYINTVPNLKLYNDDGTLSWSDNGVDYANLGLINPLSYLQGKATSENENITGDLTVNYRIVSNLNFKLNAGYNSMHTNEQSATPTAALNPTWGSLPSAQFANGNNKSWILEPQLDWRRNWKKSKWNVLAGSTLQEKIQKGNYTEGTNYRSDLLLGSIAAAGNIRSTNSYTQYRYAALFGRFNYNYDDKYILNLTGRRDGSSRFGPSKRWANFGAVGGAWVFSKEPFLNSLYPGFSFGKLRASYGTTGNDQIGDYKYLNLWQNTPDTYDGVDGLRPTSLYNPDYNWEINRKAEAGLDLGFFKDRLLVTVGYFRNRSSNQLVRYRLGAQTGFTTVVRNFPGLVQNTGWEVAASSNMQLGQIKWSTSINVTVPQNKLIKFPGLANSSYATKYVVDKSLSVIQTYKYLGIDPQTGVYTFADKNSDGQVYGSADYFVFGNTDPKIFGGFQNNFSYKNWAFGFFFQFTKQPGASYINQLQIPPGWLQNQPAIVMNRWQQPGDQTGLEKFTSGYTPVYVAYSLYSLSNAAYTDASFIRLKNISLSYMLPEVVIRKLRINRCRLYMEAQNLLTITNYKGPDPETREFYTLPPLRAVAGGIQLDF